jgi:hypothetical protein
MTSILKADTIQDTDGNNIINENSNTITIGASGDTTNIIGTLNKDGVAVANTPAFRVYLGSNMTSVTKNTRTKVTYDTEAYDTANAFASNKFTVPSGEAGKYHFSAMATMKNSSDYNFISIHLYQNGNEILRGTKLQLTDYYLSSSAYSTMVVTGDLNLSVSDYVEVYIEMGAAGGSGTVLSDDKYSAFSGHKLIE